MSIIIDMQPIKDAFSEFITAWNETFAYGRILQQAILDAFPYLADIFSSGYDIVQQFIESTKKQQRDRERANWRRFNAPKPRQFLLDERRKIHRCRNDC